jgi:2-polyprenyl-6-methoxyphenol hydroxylase-like FAD-dependent oxidoreductase
MTLETTPEYNEGRISERDDHAIVVGGSMAGLLAARVLIDAFEKVTLIERDPLPDEAGVRRGVPQARHVHALHEGGRATLDDLFPGYSNELTESGAVKLDMASDLNFYDQGDFAADGPNRIPWYCASRPLIEQITRHRVTHLDGVVVRDECQTTQYLLDDTGSTVEGVIIRNANGDEKELGAKLVVTATGRTSRIPTWLEEHGYMSPPTDEVTIDLAYSSIQLDRSPDQQQAYIVMQTPPRTRGGALFPIEDGRWLMTLAGVHGDHPPTDRDGLAEFAGDLPVSEFEQLIDKRELVSGEIAHYPFPSNRRCRYWDLDRFPDGLVVIGDAIASYNPIYGQGMSVAALEAIHLHHTLAEDQDTGRALRFFDRIKPVVNDAWKVAVGADFRFSETTGPKPPGTDLLNRYLVRYTRKAHSNGSLTDAFIRVMIMERRPTSLLHPRLMLRVLKPTL